MGIEKLFPAGGAKYCADVVSLDASLPEVVCSVVEQFLGQHPEQGRAYIFQRMGGILPVMDTIYLRGGEIQVEREVFPFSRFAFRYLVNQELERCLSGVKEAYVQLCGPGMPFAFGVEQSHTGAIIGEYEFNPRREQLGSFNNKNVPA